MNVIGLRTGDARISAVEGGVPGEAWGISARGASRTYVTYASPYNGWSPSGTSTQFSVATVGSISPSARTARSVVKDASGILQVTSVFWPPAANEGFVEVGVAVTNIGTAETLTSVKYRRIMDWDVDPVSCGVGCQSLFSLAARMFLSPLAPNPLTHCN
jgi:hypothetical protein